MQQQARGRIPAVLYVAVDQLRPCDKSMTILESLQYFKYPVKG
jgi:hypothetical protein